jgi:hypothetical protein
MTRNSANTFRAINATGAIFPLEMFAMLRPGQQTGLDVTAAASTDNHEPTTE